MYLLFVICFSLMALAVWLLYRDRKYWRDQYQTLQREARDREQNLFDQLLRMKGFHATKEPNTSQPHGVHRQPALSPEDLEIIDDRINERIEAGIIRASEGHLWATQIRDGSLTPTQLDRMMWNRQQQEFNGSVADID